MLARLEDFNSELQAKVKEATSELERRYHEVQRMQRSLSHAERLALAGRIMAEVAHEIGTPLHSVAGHLELLRQDLPTSALSDDVRRRLSVIDTQLTRVTQIIAQLLDLTRRTPGEPEAVDVNRLVTEIAEVVRPGIVAAGLRLDATTQHSLPRIAGYPNQLQQVVLNLLTNAVDATPAGGRIAVATSARERHVELAISDTGRGIPDGEQTPSGGEACVRTAKAEPCDLALVDFRMPGVDGLPALKRFVTLQPAPTVVILTAFATMETAIDAIRAGAYDYLSKPFRIDEIKMTVRRALEARRLVADNRQYRHELHERYGVDKLVGQSQEMVAIYKLVARVAALDTTILIQGETGTGKEMVARAIHYASPRADRPLVVVDCAALPEPLFESELFGHERGAFTGAVLSRRGLLETADGSTCFLDEIGELPTALQAKLLRVLQERVIRRVGGNDPVPVNVRLITATNQDLRKLVEDGRFREDLYYRLNGVTIRVPPLRERREDLPLLAQHFLRKYAEESGKAILGYAPGTLELLSAYGWPGNVRELQHVVERAVALSSSGMILADDLPTEIRAETLAPPELPKTRMTLDELKRWYRSEEHT